MLLQQRQRFALLSFELLELQMVEHQGLEAGPFPGNRLQLAGVGCHGRIGKLAFEGLEGAASRF